MRRRIRRLPHGCCAGNAFRLLRRWPHYRRCDSVGGEMMPERAPLRTPVCDVLGCDYPIVSAGMGGVARAELVAAVLAAGGYGVLGMVRESPELIGREGAPVRERTNRGFAVTLIPFGTDPALFAEELAACFELRVHALSFFWEVRPDVVRRAHEAGCKVLYQVGR